MSQNLYLEQNGSYNYLEISTVYINVLSCAGNCITVVSEEPDSCGIDFIAVACRPMSFTASLCKCRAAGFQPFEGSCIGK